MIDFTITRLPQIHFGRGKIATAIPLAANYGKRLLLVTGKQTFDTGNFKDQLLQQCEQHQMFLLQVKIESEPSPKLIDEIVTQYKSEKIDVVLGIGGGSALDAAKAIAGLLKLDNSVMDFLEGVGPELTYNGPSIPFIAAPTTAGTGSEATKNSVLSHIANDGFKKSFRDEKLVAQHAIIDPALLESCPVDIIAANGMDALTQLIESYVSIKANVFTDSLALPAIELVRDSLLTWYEDGQFAKTAQDNMAYAAMISGITLAQVGLGSVHGLASPIGAFFEIPHGVVCGTLLSSATKINIDAMLERDPSNPALTKYANLANILCQKEFSDRSKAFQELIAMLESWTHKLQLKRLNEYQISEEDLDKITKNSRGSSMKTNPIVLTDEEIKTILKLRF